MLYYILLYIIIKKTKNIRFIIYKNKIIEKKTLKIYNKN